jgi:hypothetical protein
MKKAEILSMAKSRIKAAQECLTQFAAKLVADPEHTVHWSMSMFSETANLYAWKLVQNQVENGADLEVLVDVLQEAMVGHAVRPPSSSNFAANQLEIEKGRAIAEIYRDFERRRRSIRTQAAAQATSAT